MLYEDDILTKTVWLFLHDPVGALPLEEAGRSNTATQVLHKEMQRLILLYKG